MSLTVSWCSCGGFWFDQYLGELACVQDISNYLLRLKSSSLALSLLMAHQAVILAFHPPIQGKAVFSHSVVIFLKGIVCLFPPVKEMVTLWDLNTVLATLMSSLFEPLATLVLGCPLGKEGHSCCYNICKKGQWIAGYWQRCRIHSSSKTKWPWGHIQHFCSKRFHNFTLTRLFAHLCSFLNHIQTQINSIFIC